jgi:N-methylhydantoinase A/oxoprolinase/acetone carboxylase beta subunit
MHTGKRAEETFRVGTEIGGTFTDIVFSGSKGTVLMKKTLSTPEDYSRAIAQGISDGYEPVTAVKAILRFSESASTNGALT